MNNSGATHTGAITFDSGLALLITQAQSGYVASKGSTTVASGIAGPFGVGVDSAGNVYFVERTGGNLKKWDKTTQTVSTLLTSLGEPEQIAVDGAGNVYVTDRDNGRVPRFTASPQAATDLVTGLQLPIGIAVDPNGNVYFSDSGDHNLKVWSSTTKQVTTLVSSGLPEPSALALDSQGNLYIADYTEATLMRWNIATQTLTTVISSGLLHPAGLTVDGSGNVYLADFSANSIYTGNPVSQQITTFRSPIGVHHIALDSLINVYYADFGGNAIRAIIQARVPTAGFTEAASSGSDQTLPVLPIATPLTGVFAPTSDQNWLTPGPAANGIVPFSFIANPDASRTGLLTVVGNPITVTQAGVVAAITKNAGDSQTIGAGQAAGTGLLVKLTNSGSAAVAGGHVTFAVIPGGGGSSGTFAGSPAQPIVSLADGTATAPTLTANSTPGNFNVTATIGSLTTTFNLNIGMLSQAITFGALSDAALGTTPATLSAAASSSLGVSFASTTTTICSVSGTAITLLAIGQCSIQATQAGNSPYSAAAPVSATATSSLPVSFNSQTTPVCTVSGSSVTLVAVGDCTIQATQTGNANYASATAVSQSFPVTKANQTIAFGILSDHVFGSGSFSLSATASSLFAVSFVSQTTPVCRVSGSTVTLVSVGTCTIQASQSGDGNYNAAAPVNQSFSVTQGGQTITFGILGNRALSAGPFTVSGTASSGLAVSFALTTPSICTVSGVSVTLVATGTSTVQATQSGNTNYSAATPVNQTFQITSGSQTITFDALTNQVFGTAPFGVSATATSGRAVSFSSLTIPVCTLSGSPVTLVGAGACTIQATQSGDSNYAAATPVSQSFQVTSSTQAITFGALSNQAFGTTPFAIGATASSRLPVSFNSQTTAVCTVSGSTATLITTGICTVQATQAGNANYAAATPVNQSFQVTSSAQTITFAALSNQAFGTAPFTVGATTSSSLPVSFNSQTTGVCTVSGSTVAPVTPSKRPKPATSTTPPPPR